MITAGTDLSINIRQVNDKLTVAVMPRRAGLKDEAGGQIVPLVLNGTPEELDMEFLGAITAPVQTLFRGVDLAQTGKTAGRAGQAEGD